MSIRIHVLSDLHTEFSRPSIPFTDADVVVLAGDIGVGAKGVEWALAEPSFAGKPLIFVPGNHEFYGSQMREVTKSLKALQAANPRLHVLENEVADFVINGELVRFLGSTLWTDFHLFGEDDLVSYGLCLTAARRSVNDFSTIRYGAHFLEPIETVQMHLSSVQWLREQLDNDYVGQTVIVVHHAPHPGSVAPKYADDPVTAAFVSNLSGKGIFGMAPVLIHGHTHASFDYVVEENGGATRVVANPRGYPTMTGPENEAFDPGLVIELAAKP